MSIQQQIVRVQEKGLITIPVAFRKSLGLKKDCFAKIYKEKGRLILEPVSMLPYPVRSYTNEEIAEFVKLDRKETKNSE
jgi:bifunctional DNA-binding transcriptional regulator/antitoxin component of YhaV-PrlF toxin-antitoxin module